MANLLEVKSMAGRRQVVITGVGGFIGSRLASRLLAEPDFNDAFFTLTDVRIPEKYSDARVRVLEGNLGDRGVLSDVLNGRADVLFHLAGILGGAAEGNYPLSRKVNVDATLDLLELLRDEKRPPRVVFASSVAVFGPPLPSEINDDTMPVPVMNYGGQKLMIEIAVEQFSAHGWIDGLAIRLPGIVARRSADARLKSAFLNTMFYDYAAGVDFTIPVSPEGTIWLISVAACVQALVHAARVPPSQLGSRRAITLPAQRVSMAALVRGLAEQYPKSRSKVTWAPDPALEALFTRQPPLTTALGDALGFKHDGSIANLIARAIQPE